MTRQGLGALIEGATVVRAVVVEATRGRVLVATDGTGERMECDVLQGALSGRPGLSPGDPVLVVPAAAGATRGCVLGAVRPYEPGPAARGAAPDLRRITARRIVVEAGERLELRVAGSTIVITEDGKIVIQGKNVLSRARALNKIRGAAVQIN